MRTLCDSCEAAAAQFFCAADEAALCAKCDEKESFMANFANGSCLFKNKCSALGLGLNWCNSVKVHSCNKLASRHIRLQLRESWSVPRCDICETAPAFLHCSIDGSSLCLQCDMDVHIGGKRTHQRYLLLGQRVELPNGLNLLEENGNGKTVDTGRAWQKKYCQEHLHSVAPCHKTNVETNGHLNNGTPCNKKNVEPNGAKD